MKPSTFLVSMALAAACGPANGEPVVKPAADAALSGIEQFASCAAGAALVLFVIFILINAVRAAKG